jgi:SAM-dependent methyltransferase
MIRPSAIIGVMAADEPPFTSLLYTEPRLYDLAFPADTMRPLCLEACRRWLPAPPRSTLDLGCGSGRHLAALAATIPDCWGVDLLASNVAYAQARQPGLRIDQGDMRTVRLGRTFDLVTSGGNALSYALTDDDLRRTVETYAAHAHPGTLLVVDALNARAYLDGDGFRERIEGRLDTPEFTATSVAIHALDRAARRLTRLRTWTIPGRPPVQDRAEYRLLQPEELRALLDRAGFAVRALHDNRELRDTDLAGAPAATGDVGGMGGRKLYAVAQRG